MVQGLRVFSGSNTVSIDNRYEGYVYQQSGVPRKLHESEYITAYKHGEDRSVDYVPAVYHPSETTYDVITNARAATQHTAAKYYIDVECHIGEPLAFIECIAADQSEWVPAAILGVNKGVPLYPMTHRIYITVSCAAVTSLIQLPYVHIFVPSSNKGAEGSHGLKLKNGNKVTFNSGVKTLQATGILTAPRPAYPTVDAKYNISGSIPGDTTCSLIKGLLSPLAHITAVHYVTQTPFELVSATPHIREFWHTMVSYTSNADASAQEMKITWKLGSRYDNGEKWNYETETPSRRVIDQPLTANAAVSSWGLPEQEWYDATIANRVLHPRTQTMPEAIPNRLAAIDVRRYKPANHTTQEARHGWYYAQGYGTHWKMVIQLAGRAGLGNTLSDETYVLQRRVIYTREWLRGRDWTNTSGPTPGMVAELEEKMPLLWDARYEDFKMNVSRRVVSKCMAKVREVKAVVGDDPVVVKAAIMAEYSPPLPAALRGWLKAFLSLESYTQGKYTISGYLGVALNSTGVTHGEKYMAGYPKSIIPNPTMTQIKNWDWWGEEMQSYLYFNSNSIEASVEGAANNYDTLAILKDWLAY